MVEVEKMLVVLEEKKKWQDREEEILEEIKQIKEKRKKLSKEAKELEERIKKYEDVLRSTAKERSSRDSLNINFSGEMKRIE